MGKYISHVINGATATTSSSWYAVGLAKRIGFFFKRSNHSSGSSAFKVEISPDGTDANAVQYNKLIDNVANTNAQTPTRVASSSLASDTIKYYSMDVNDALGYIKVTVTETTDGTHDAWIVVQDC